MSETVITDSIAEAAQFIRRGGVVAFPTETVYGLGANVLAAAAVRKIFAAKGRPPDNPLIVHIAARGDLPLIAKEITPSARRLIAAFFPGPLTVVLRKSEAVPEVATAGLETVGIRMPQHPLAHEFIKACGAPLAAPSANLSGRPSPTTWQAVAEDLAGRIDCILRGAPTSVGLESTVVDCIGDAPVLLRAGAITLEQLRAVTPAIVLRAAGRNEQARSPGLKYKHYSPQAQVRVVADAEQAIAASSAGYIGLTAPPDRTGFKLARVCVSAEDYARQLFEFFRECDRAGVETIYCQAVAETGLGLALMDRLRRAAS